MMKEGLLDAKTGKPNEKTPADWKNSYQTLTHYGPKSAAASGGDAGQVSAQQDEGHQEETEQDGEEKQGEKKKKKKIKKEMDAE